MKKLLYDWRFAVLLVLTLGLAPYRPEPHFFGKVRWVLGGAVGMKPIDWFDLLLHGVPWLFLVWVIAWNIFRRKPTGKSGEST